jgi:dihydrofolate reductase
MRKIWAGEFISLDGDIESANQLTGEYFNEEFGQYLASGMARTDALLLGRVTYQEMAPFWQAKTGTEDPVAVHMSKPKFVVSTTLDNTNDWSNSTLIRDNPAEELTKLKQQPGKDILVIGSASLVRWLLRVNLLDELDLLVFPVIVGRGKHLFSDDSDKLPLTLTSSETFSTGVVHLTYRPTTA